MPVKHQKCCCCPECVITPQRCCKCVPRTICFTLAGPSEECSIEIDYSPASDSWTGSVTCFDETVNFVLFFDKDEDGACYLGLRSEELGIGEGYEQKWYISDDFPCELMTNSVDFGDGAEFRFEPVDKVKPFNCRGCKCLCECVCIFVTAADGTTCAGKLCWDYQSNAWIGDILCQEYEGDATYPARLEFHPRGEFCDQLEDEDPYCDPYDETCILVLQIPALGIVNQIIDLPEECEERNVTFTETLINSDDEEVIVTVRCAACNAECEDGCGIRYTCPATPTVLIPGVIDELEDPNLCPDCLTFETWTLIPWESILPNNPGDAGLCRFYSEPKTAGDCFDGGIWWIRMIVDLLTVGLPGPGNPWKITGAQVSFVLVSLGPGDPPDEPPVDHLGYTGPSYAGSICEDGMLELPKSAEGLMPPGSSTCRLPETAWFVIA